MKAPLRALRLTIFLHLTSASFMMAPPPPPHCGFHIGRLLGHAPLHALLRQSVAAHCLLNQLCMASQAALCLLGALALLYGVLFKAESRLSTSSSSGPSRPEGTCFSLQDAPFKPESASVLSEKKVPDVPFVTEDVALGAASQGGAGCPL